MVDWCAGSRLLPSSQYWNLAVTRSRRQCSPSAVGENSTHLTAAPPSLPPALRPQRAAAGWPGGVDPRRIHIIILCCASRPRCSFV